MLVTLVIFIKNQYNLISTFNTDLHAPQFYKKNIHHRRWTLWGTAEKFVCLSKKKKDKISRMTKKEKNYHRSNLMKQNFIYFI